MGFVIQTVENNTVTFAWGQTQEQINAKQKYNVYIDNVLYGTYDSAQAITCNISQAGEHTITVKAVLNGVESAGVSEKVTISKEETTTTLPTVAPTEKATENDTSGITISDDVKVEGFQISNILEGLRTVSSVEPSINGKNVVEFGNIYAVDVDSVSDDDMYVGVENKFVAAVNSTSNGITDRQFSKSDTATNYVMTMTDNGKTVPALTQSYKIRAYAKLSDGTYLYSKVAKFSIFNVAKTLYDNSKMNTNAGHDYLYDNILKVVDSNYKKVDYDWSVIVVK